LKLKKKPRRSGAWEVEGVAEFGCRLEHDPEKWVPVFRKDHAPPIS
jgi:hypothetical protein